VGPNRRRVCAELDTTADLFTSTARDAGRMLTPKEAAGFPTRWSATGSDSNRTARAFASVAECNAAFAGDRDQRADDHPGGGLGRCDFSHFN
jgi:hypothetical protein